MMFVLTLAFTLEKDLLGVQKVIFDFEACLQDF